MFHVTTVNLTPDLRTAAADLGSCDFGELDAEQLSAVLENFRLLDAVQNHEAEPQIVVASAAGKFRIRTGGGRLFLYNARDAHEACVELDADAIVRELGRPLPAAAGEAVVGVAPAAKTPHHGIAAAILAAGLLLNGYTLHSVFHLDDVNRKPPVEFVTNPTELTALQLSVVGRYATGTSPGDRAIVVGADGRVRFLKVLRTGERLDSEDSFRIGRHHAKLCLATADNGLIDVVDIDTIVYYRDTYRRTR